MQASRYSCVCDGPWKPMDTLLRTCGIKLATHNPSDFVVCMVYQNHAAVVLTIEKVFEMTFVMLNTIEAGIAQCTVFEDRECAVSVGTVTVEYTNTDDEWTCEVKPDMGDRFWEKCCYHNDVEGLFAQGVVEA
jgi:hypothetical protein